MLKWQGIISAIPLRWKTGKPVYVRPELPICICGEDEMIILSLSTHKQIRKHVSKEFFSAPTSRSFFNRMFDIEQTEWTFLYSMPFLVTVYTKLREFQWKLNHNILYTNAMLFHMNSPLVASDNCTFCDNACETLVHLFCECEAVECIWRAIYNLWGQYLKCPRKFSAKQIILGDKHFSNLLNHIILMTKMSIYVCKLKKELPSLGKVIADVKYTKNIEHKISERKNSLPIYLNKWSDLAI